MPIPLLPRHVAVICALTVACSSATGPDDERPAPEDHATPVALDVLGRDTYLGLEGGLYLDGSNNMPADHRAEALRRLALDGRSRRRSGRTGPGRRHPVRPAISATTARRGPAGDRTCGRSAARPADRLDAHRFHRRRAPTRMAAGAVLEYLAGIAPPAAAGPRCMSRLRNQGSAS